MSSDVLEIFSFIQSIRWSNFERDGSAVSRISSSELSQRVLGNSTLDFPLSVLRVRFSRTLVALCFMRQPEIKEAVLRGAAPLQLYRVIANHAPEPKATVRHVSSSPVVTRGCTVQRNTGRHMQLTAFKRANAQLQHRVQVYAQEEQHTSHDRRMYYKATEPPRRTCIQTGGKTTPATTPHSHSGPRLPGVTCGEGGRAQPQEYGGSRHPTRATP